MKAKTIKKALRKKFDNFCASIDDDNVRSLVEKNSIITGGAIASMLINEHVRDFDVYFTNGETAKTVAEYFVDRFRQVRKEYFDIQVIVGRGGESDGAYKPHYEEDRVWIFLRNAGVAGDPQPGIAGETLGDDLEPTEPDVEDDQPDYQPIFLSQNAITLSGKIQLIIRFFGEPDTIHENYDFAHCTNYWLSKDGSLTLRPKALEALLTKELVYIGSKYPVCSIIRTRKFIRRGFSVTAGQYLKMILQCNELDLFDIDVLEDQLVGVDSAYFMQVIEAVKEKKPELINAAYLSEIIDRIF